MRAFFDPTLYLVTDPDMTAERGLVETARAAVDGGATMIQIRDKRADRATRVGLARAVKAALAGRGAVVLINDDIDAALEAGADGVHIGQSDGDPVAARARIGADRILGLSVETVAQAHAADGRVVDYLGVGPVFATATKPDHAAPLGLEGLAEAVRAARAVPCVAIGGVGLAQTADVIAAGARGVAVVSAICAAHDPEEAARALRASVFKARAAALTRDGPQ